MLAKKRIIISSLILIVFLCVASLVLFATPIAHAGSIDNQLCTLPDYVSNSETIEINDTFEVYGNQSELSEEKFRNLVDEGENKVYIHYRTDRNIELNYDALILVKTISKIFTYSFKESDDVSSEELTAEIKWFVLMQLDEINANIYAVQNYVSENSNNITTSFADSLISEIFVCRFSNYGYITYIINVSEYATSSQGSLYICSVRNLFQPGSVAIKNGDTSFSDYLNDSGFIHMKVGQAYDRFDEDFYGKPRYGGRTFVKDFWPANSPSTVSISSSLESGINFGFSTANGFSLKGDGSIDYKYSKTITVDNPRIVVSTDVDTPDKIEWFYEYMLAPESSVAELTTYYMFEMSNRSDMLRGDFRLQLEFLFRFSFLNDNSYVYTSKTANYDLMIRANTYKTVVDFDDGKWRC